MIQVNAAGKSNTGEAATWAEGDFNADGRVDILDMVYLQSSQGQ